MGDLRLVEAISMSHKRNRFMVSFNVVCACGYQSNQSDPLVLKKAEIQAYLMGSLEAARLTHECGAADSKRTEIIRECVCAAKKGIDTASDSPSSVACKVIYEINMLLPEHERPWNKRDQDV